jgi:hypothetical protein
MAIGWLVSYVVTVAICYLALDTRWMIVLVGSTLPAFFAGPTVGMLLSLRTYMARERAAAERARLVRDGSLVELQRASLPSAAESAA